MMDGIVLSDRSKVEEVGELLTIINRVRRPGPTDWNVIRCLRAVFGLPDMPWQRLHAAISTLYTASNRRILVVEKGIGVGTHAWYVDGATSCRYVVLVTGIAANFSVIVRVLDARGFLTCPGIRRRTSFTVHPSALAVICGPLPAALSVSHCPGAEAEVPE